MSRFDQGKPRRILSVVPLFRHTQEQYHLYKAMVGGEGIDLVINAIHHHMSHHIQEQIEAILPDGHNPAVPPLIIANYLAGTMLTLHTWWLDNNMPYSPERMDEMFQELTMPGVWATLGLSIQVDK